MNIPEDLGQRIVEATRLAVNVHMQFSLCDQSIPGGTGRRMGRACLPIGGADLYGGAAMDGGDLTPLQAHSTGACTLAKDGASAADREAA